LAAVKVQISHEQKKVDKILEDMDHELIDHASDLMDELLINTEDFDEEADYVYEMVEDIILEQLLKLRKDSKSKQRVHLIREVVDSESSSDEEESQEYLPFFE